MTKTMLALAGAALLVGGAELAAKDDAVPACCRHKKQASTAEEAKPQKPRCSLTGKVVDKCCCVEREGKTHCTLANKDVVTCCCKPVANEKKS